MSTDNAENADTIAEKLERCFIAVHEDPEMEYENLTEVVQEIRRSLEIIADLFEHVPSNPTCRPISLASAVVLVCDAIEDGAERIANAINRVSDEFYSK